MIEQHNTQPTDLKSLWAHQKEILLQRSFREDRGEEPYSLGFKGTQERERAQEGVDSSELRIKSVWPSLNCQEAPESERRHGEVYPSQPRQRCSWHQMILQGWPAAL